MSEREPIWATADVDGDPRARLLHIHPQDDNHADAEIYGSPEALRRLAKALLEAADAGKAQVEMMCRDGEGYHVLIAAKDEWQFDADPLPYSARGLRFYQADCMAARAEAAEAVCRKLAGAWLPDRGAFALSALDAARREAEAIAARSGEGTP